MSKKNNSYLIYEQFPVFQALNLSERTAHIQKNVDIPSVQDDALIQMTVAQWKAQHPFSEEGIFAQRLAIHGIEENELPYYMNRGHFPSHIDEQTWMSELGDAWKLFEVEKDHIRFPEEIATNWPIVRFLEIFQPFLQHACSKLMEGIRELHQKHEVIPFKQDAIIKMFLMNVPTYLISAVSRTLVLELHIARLEGKLLKDTPQERFEEFIQLFQQPTNLQNLLQEYPVLTRMISTLVYQWRENILEFLTHLCQNWNKLQSTFDFESGSELLKGFQVGVGDRHRNGRSVIICQFSSGLRLVYKPRSMAIDEQFQSLLDWFNEYSSQLPPFRLLTTLDYETHGWVEFIGSQPCQTVQEIKRFYTRLGAYLALLYALGATDFHYENIVAEGEHPVLIDLETLFSPVIGKEITSNLPASQFMFNSVMSSHLLPNRIWAEEGGPEGIDISGIGMQEGQLTSLLPVWEQVNTDEMHLTRTRLPIKAKTHQPRLEDKKINAIEYMPEIIDGFTSMYDLLLSLRTELLDKNGPLAKFSHTQLRILLRPTRIYSLLHQEGLHPDLMGDALQLDQHFDHLWARGYSNKNLRAFIDHEYKDMWQFDIPVFSTFPASTDLWSSKGTKIERFFEVSGLEHAKNKINQLSHADMVRQCWLIHTSLSTLRKPEKREAVATPYSSASNAPTTNLNHEQLLMASIKIGNRLQQLAIHNDHYVSWLGIDYMDEGDYWAIAPLRLSLYNGLPGIALFLAYLGSASNDSNHTELAQKTVKTILYTIDNEDHALSDVGAFDGWGSIVYLLAHLGVLWNDAHLLEKAETIAESIRDHIVEDHAFDIISGSAGCLAALIALYKVTKNLGVLNTAVICANHLIDNASIINESVAWLPRNASSIDQPLTGFSHGVAGICWALSQLAEITRNVHYTQIVQKGLAYERNLFSAEAGNWPDLRNYSASGESSNQEQPIYLNFWCHGAPGIGLSRLSMMKSTTIKDNLIKGEVDIAYHTTVAQGFGNGHCLCHGDLGSLEFLNEANSCLALQGQHQIDQLVQGVLDSIKNHGWLCGNGLRVEEPGLMTGLAGIGYGLLRFAKPDQIPSILILEPPILD